MKEISGKELCVMCGKRPISPKSGAYRLCEVCWKAMNRSVERRFMPKGRAFH